MSQITFDEVLSLFKETDLKFKETDRKFQETDRKFQETDRKFQETEQRFKETDRKIQESFEKTKLLLAHERQNTEKVLREVSKQIGGLGEKFGGYTEGMAFNAMQRILADTFGMENIHQRARSHKEGREMELDVLAWANGKINRVVIVEVKSHPLMEAIPQLIRQLRNFRFFYPEHAAKSVVGILAGVDWKQGVREKALAAGLYVAAIHDDLFELQTPSGFQPKVF